MMILTATKLCLAVACGLLIAAVGRSAAAGDWPCWRGPDGNGISRETGWLDRWPAGGPPIAWKASVGTGYSSVAVKDGRLLTMGSRENTDVVHCLDAATGKTLWRHSYPSPLDDRFFAGGPTATPAIDGRHVYTLGRQGDLFCLEAATGKVRWSVNVAKAAGVRVPGWGFAGSPVVLNHRLLLNVGEAGTAVDKSTGKVLWTSADRDAGYTTPLPIQRGGRSIMILASGKYYHAVDIETGKQLWRHRWLTTFGCNAADPIVRGDRLYISSAYNRGAALLDLSADPPAVVWTNKQMQNQFSSSVLIDGHLYGIDGSDRAKTRLTCMELLTGKLRWSHELEGMGSLTAAGGKLIVLDEPGVLLLARAMPDAFRPLARAKVTTGKCWTAPVLAGGRIYCRSDDGTLVSVDVRIEKDKQPIPTRTDP